MAAISPPFAFFMLELALNKNHPIEWLTKAQINHHPV
jgi:hypothetical protein